MIDDVAKELCEIEEVLEVYEVMGSASYFVKIAAENNNDAQPIQATHSSYICQNLPEIALEHIVDMRSACYA